MYSKFVVFFSPRTLLNSSFSSLFNSIYHHTNDKHVKCVSHFAAPRFPFYFYSTSYMFQWNLSLHLGERRKGGTEELPARSLFSVTAEKIDNTYFSPICAVCVRRRYQTSAAARARCSLQLFRRFRARHWIKRRARKKEHIFSLSLLAARCSLFRCWISIQFILISFSTQPLARSLSRAPRSPFRLCLFYTFPSIKSFQHSA